MDSAVLLAVANHDRIVTLRRPLDQDTNELPQVLLVGVVERNFSSQHDIVHVR